MTSQYIYDIFHHENIKFSLITHKLCDQIILNNSFAFGTDAHISFFFLVHKMYDAVKGCQTLTLNINACKGEFSLKFDDILN